MTFAGLIAHSRPMRELLDQIRRFAAADANVLISGETGVGKDAAARALHLAGPRRDHPFVKVDCPSLPPALVESELFGYERGAFTGATASKAGRLELAGPGTVYLDSVHELVSDVQGKLLRVVEDKRLERVGGINALALQARIIASTDHRIEEAVRGGTFRGDLYHRLRVLPLRIPPLRDRPADILPLARAFLREAARRLGRPPLTLTASAAAALEGYHWPGNVRELRHVLERTALLIETPGRAKVDASDLPLEILAAPPPQGAETGQRLPTLEEVERRHIEHTLRTVRGNQTHAAAILGISRKALWEKRKKYGLM